MENEVRMEIVLKDEIGRETVVENKIGRGCAGQ